MNEIGCGLTVLCCCVVCASAQSKTTACAYVKLITAKLEPLSGDRKHNHKPNIARFKDKTAFARRSHSMFEFKGDDSNLHVFDYAIHG